ncbi:MAG: hypothetical protein AB7U62_19205 [Pseudolabrys sp.]
MRDPGEEMQRDRGDECMCPQCTADCLAVPGGAAPAGRRAVDPDDPASVDRPASRFSAASAVALARSATGGRGRRQVQAAAAEIDGAIESLDKVCVRSADQLESLADQFDKHGALGRKIADGLQDVAGRLRRTAQ